jgi:hypothetical protein
MAIDSHYIPAFSLETVFVDKDSGAPLSGGTVTFQQANQPLNKKPVYQITETSGVYNYTALPNPMTLSSIGTFEDSLGNPVVPYFYPYDSDVSDANINVEYYRVVVESSGGVEQFVRNPVPYVEVSGSSTLASAHENELSNPQFAEVLFDTISATHEYSFSAANLEVVDIAPNWSIVASSIGSGTVTVSQTKPTGTENIPTNPGTLLTITSGGLSYLRLRQRIYGSPNLWGSGYLAGSFVASTAAGSEVELVLYYSQSNGAVVDKEIVSATLEASGAYGTYPGNVFIAASDSTETYPDAYVDIEFQIPPNVEVDITSVMIAFTDDAALDNLQYDQETAARNVDHLFHYYKPQLEYMPIPSYLVGWDFPMNPAQFLGDTIASTAFNIGANKSQYIWDQTIAFQSVDEGISVARTTTGALKITAALDTQMAIIQYLDQAQARELLLGNMAVNVNAKASSSTVFTVSLWYTESTNLPSVAAASNNSIVASLDANGHPTAESSTATWVEIGRANQGNAQGTLTTSFDDYMFNQWTTSGTGSTAATFFAIVIGTAELTAADTVTFDSVGLMKGDIATRPAPKTQVETLRDCQRYYETSFPPYASTAIPYATTDGLVFAPMRAGPDIGTTLRWYPNNFGHTYAVRKRTKPSTADSTLKFYSGQTATVDKIEAYVSGTAVNQTELTRSSYFTFSASGSSKSGFYFVGTPVSSGSIVLTTAITNAFIGYANILYHFTADARLGIVN